MLVTVNMVKHMTLLGSHASQITPSKILVTQILVRVSSEIGPILVSHFLGNDSLKELLAVHPKKAMGMKRKRKKLARQLQSFLRYTNTQQG